MRPNGTDTATPTAPLPLWKNRDYVVLWCGQLVNVIGSQISQIAYPLLVLALTASPAQAGFVAAARTVPYLLFALPAGALVDRWDRKRTMRLCSAGSALALMSIAIAYALGVLTIAQIVVVSFVEGSLSLVFGLAEASALPQLVPPEQVPTAVAQSQAQYSVAALVGPPLGGTLYGISHLLPFVADAASYAVSTVSLGLIRVRFQGKRDHAARALLAEIAEGVRWLWGQPLVRYMAFLTGSLNFASGFQLIVIVLAEQQQIESASIGAVFALAGAGGLLGAFIAPRIQQRLSFGQAIIAVCWVWVLFYVLLASVGHMLAVAVILAAFAVITPTYDTVQFSYRLALIPDVLQGRVNSAFRLVALGMQPLGLALTGVLLQTLGVGLTALVFAGWLAFVTLLTSLNSHVRRAPPLARQIAV